MIDSRLARRATTILALLVVVGLVAGCGAQRGPVRAPFTALAVGGDSRPLGRAELDRLAAAGVGELFVAAGELDWSGGGPRIVATAPSVLPRAAKSTLVISGTWRREAESAGRTADAWASAIDEMASRAGEWNAVVVGVHFDLAIDADGEALATVLRRLRRDLRGRLFVSVALDPDRAEAEVATRLARAVDFVVVDVFGNDPGGDDSPQRWDRVWTRARLAAARRLDTRYVAGIWTRGAAERRSRSGERTPIALTSGLADVLRSPAWAPRAGALLESVDRQVRELVAEEPVMLGPLAIRRGDTLRFARPTTHDLEEVLAVLREEADERCLGSLLRRLPPPGDEISLAPANVAAAYEPGAARPDIGLEVRPDGGDARQVYVRLRLVNRNAEATELASGDLNYADLGFPAAALISVEPGDFAGWEQLWHGHERRTLRALREADTLRLSAPYVGGGEHLESGRIVLRRSGGGIPALRTAGHFLLPGGEELTLAEQAAVWSTEEN